MTRTIEERISDLWGAHSYHLQRVAEVSEPATMHNHERWAMVIKWVIESLTDDYDRPKQAGFD